MVLAAVSTLSLGMLGSSFVLWRSLQGRSASRAPLDARSLEELTGLALGLMGAVAVAWLLACAAVAVLARWAAKRGHRRGGMALTSLLPGFIARLALAGIGGSVALAGCSLGAISAGAAVAVAAAPVPEHRLAVNTSLQLHDEFQPAPSETTSPAAKATELLSPGFVPHRLPLPLPRLAGGTPRDLAEVVVRSGDSLWSIAAKSLPVDAGAAEIAAAWPRWYETNHELIGNDPNHLEVGMVLLPPGPTPLRP